MLTEPPPQPPTGLPSGLRASNSRVRPPDSWARIPPVTRYAESQPSSPAAAVDVITTRSWVFWKTSPTLSGTRAANLSTTNPRRSAARGDGPW